MLVVPRLQSCAQRRAEIRCERDRTVVVRQDPNDRVLVPARDPRYFLLHEIVVKANGYAPEEPELTDGRHELNGMERYSDQPGTPEVTGGQ